MQAYIQGRTDLGGFFTINKPAKRRMFWLPLGAGLARASLRKQLRFDPRATPMWKDLTKVEQRALAMCWQMLRTKEPNALDIAEDYLWLLGDFKGLEHACAPNRGSLVDAPQKRSFLKQDSVREVASYRSVFSGVVHHGGQDLPHHHIARILERCVIAQTLYGNRRADLPDPKGFERSLLDATPEWLAQYRDPGFWHVLSPNLIELTYVTHFARQVLPILDWILNQPDCDLATAASAFVMLDGPNLTTLPPDALEGETVIGGYEQQTERRALALDIIARAQAGLYTNRALSLTGLEDGAGDKDAPGMPPQLFAKGFEGGQARTPFYLDDGTIYLALL